MPTPWGDCPVRSRSHVVVGARHGRKFRVKPKTTGVKEKGKTVLDSRKRKGRSSLNKVGGGVEGKGDVQSHYSHRLQLTHSGSSRRSH